jgi:hypothetical protein
VSSKFYISLVWDMQSRWMLTAPQAVKSFLVGGPLKTTFNEWLLKTKTLQLINSNDGLFSKHSLHNSTCCPQWIQTSSKKKKRSFHEPWEVLSNFPQLFENFVLIEKPVLIEKLSTPTLFKMLV